MKASKILNIFMVASALLLLNSCSSTKAAEKNFVPKKVEVPQTVTFPSKDGVPVTADLYLPYDKNAPLVLLCHRAKWSRGEYLEIAPKLNLLGFNAIAIDQRSGKTKNNIDNATALAAEGAGKATTYLDAVQDIQSAIDYGFSNHASSKIILWGSSYSASLSLTLLENNKDKVKACLCFSPGEYFGDLGKETDWIKKEAEKVTVPVFITSKISEEKDSHPIFNAIKTAEKTYYLPIIESKHGSQALYETTEGFENNWAETQKFLQKVR